MKIAVLILLFIGLSSNSFSQEECKLDYYVTNPDEVKELNADRIELALSSIEINCLQRNAEYSEMVNEYIFLCLTYQTVATIKVLNKNKCEPFYKTVLKEIANPVSDMYDFQTIFCNISTLEGNKTLKVKNEVLDTFTKGILGVIPEAEKIIKVDCK